MGVFDNLFKKGKKESSKAKANFIDDEWVEVTAGSREEAIDRAATALNSNEDHLEIQWLSKDGKKLRARRQEEGAKASKPKPKRQKRTRRSSNGNQKSKAEMKKDFDDDRDDNKQEASQERSYKEEPYEEEVEEETKHGLKAKDLLKEIVQCIDKPSSVELYETNKTIRLEIESSESGLFIGKHGQTLDAIQHVMMKMMMKSEHEKYLVIDAEDYRIRREESLETKARKLAKKARKEKRPIGVEPMNAIDRRIVHIALRGEPGVETKSIGEGSSRRVLIVPKGHQRKSGGNNRNRGNSNRSNNRSYESMPRREKEYEGPSRGGDSFDEVDGY